MPHTLRFLLQVTLFFLLNIGLILLAQRVIG